MNDEIRTYLAMPDTHRLYSAGLKLLAAYGLPTYQQQYTELSTGGPVGGNRSSLMAILGALSSVKEPPPAAAIQPKSVTPKTGEELNTEVDLLLSIRRMRQERAKLSQQFHSCATDEERAAVCDAIDKQNQLIAKREGEISYFQRHRQMPQDPTPLIEGDLPTTEQELSDLRRRLSSNILKKEKAIDTLLSLPETHSRRSRLPKLQADLNLLMARRDLVRRKIRTIRNEEE